MTDYSPQGVAEWLDDHGRHAFQAYREHAKGLTYDGCAIPEWGDLSEEVRSHWIHAAIAAIAHHVKAISDVSRETTTEGGPDGA